MKKINISHEELIKYIGAFLLLLIALIMRKTSIIRLLLSIGSIILLILNTSKYFKKLKNKKYSKVLIFILYLFIIVIIDSIIALTFNKIPIFSYNIVSLKNTRVYNAVGLRAWQCDKSDYKHIKVTPFYEKGYSCDATNMESIDINTLLSNISKTYDNYKNRYIKINGKISSNNKKNYIELQMYDEISYYETGEATFIDETTIRVIFGEYSEELSVLNVGDDILVAGIIKNMETDNNKTIIYMYESEIVNNFGNNNYTITFNTNDTQKELIYASDDYDLYSYGIGDILVNYDDNNIYELASLLSTNDVTIESLYENGKQTKSDDAATLYKKNNYNILVCDNSKSRDIIMGDNNLSLDNSLCSSIDN